MPVDHDVIFDDGEIQIKLTPDCNEFLCEVSSNTGDMIALDKPAMQAIMSFFAKFPGESQSQAVSAILSKTATRSHMRDAERMGEVSIILNEFGSEATVDITRGIDILQDKRKENPELVDTMICAAMYLLCSLITDELEPEVYDGSE